ncbi:MAG: cytochrome c family protein [Myxococcota bacterium]
MSPGGILGAARWGLRLVFPLVLALPPAPGRSQEHQYVGAAKCKSCHGKELMGDQYASWLADPHHRAFETLRGEPSQKIAREQGLSQPPHEAEECLSCHITAFGVPPTRIAKTLSPSDGVQCESCHGPGRDYRKKKIMSDRERAASKGLWDAGREAKICTTCHNPQSPTFDPKRYQLSDGSHAGFDFEQAKVRIAHPIPEDVKGHYLELEKAQKEARDAAEE